MIIRSDSNEKFKFINKLKKKKYRKKYGAFVAESVKVVKQIPSDMEVLFIFVNEDMKDFKTDYEKIVFSNSLFKKLSSLENPEGVSACIKIKDSLAISSDKILLLDHLQDPGNLGTIMRSAEAFGFNDIILINNNVDIYNEKTIRASMGSIFRLNFIESSVEKVEELLNDYRLLLADMKGESPYKFKKIDKLILAIGNEANGIGEKLRNLTDDFVSIKMQGEIESLNAAIAASILMNNLAKAD